MGAFSFSIDSKLLAELVASGNFHNFVETGTFHADTALLAGRHFKKVWTVEASAELYSKLGEKFRDKPNIIADLSDSPSWLRQICQQSLVGSTVFWLDAHWCSAESTEGVTSQCPLLAELDAIKQLKPGDVVLIDDARLYLVKPPPPHDSADWPTFTAILKGLRRLSDIHEIRVVNDVIIVFPPELRATVDAYSDKYGKDLVELIWKAREYETIASAHARRKKTFLGRLKNRLKRFVSKLS